MESIGLRPLTIVCVTWPHNKHCASKSPLVVHVVPSPKEYSRNATYLDTTGGRTAPSDILVGTKTHCDMRVENPSRTAHRHRTQNGAAKAEERSSGSCHFVCSYKRRSMLSILFLAMLLKLVRQMYHVSIQ